MGCAPSNVRPTEGGAPTAEDGPSSAGAERSKGTVTPTGSPSRSSAKRSGGAEPSHMGRGDSLSARELKQLSKPPTPSRPTMAGRLFGSSSGGGSGGGSSRVAPGSSRAGFPEGDPEAVLGGAASRSYKFRAFADRFNTLEEVTQGLREAGLESSNLIVAVDYTKSNLWQTRFGPQGLHTIAPTTENPYQRVIRTIGSTLGGLDDDGLIPAFGFGDSTTTDRSVFPFFSDRPARGFQELLARYAEVTPKVVMSGPTSFAPAIEAAMRIVRQTQQYHILLVIADGQVTNANHTAAAIVRASELPLSIVIVGVGDGIDMAAMNAMDDGLPQRAFDNIQFVYFKDDMSDVQFTVAALQEVPDQFMAIRQLGYI